MGFYCEITLLPNPEVNIYFLWSKVYQQIHLSLVEMQDDQGRVPIGISFPEYVTGERFSVLGGKLRLFAADEATLTKFDATKWLSRLSDYVHCTSIRPVPDRVKGYAIYQRLQPKTNPERLARRYLRRWEKHHPGETAPDLATVLSRELPFSVKDGAGAVVKQTLRYCDMSPSAVRVPFIRLQSLSGGHSFCLWIQKKTVEAAVAGPFSCYGLSVAATVPEFD